MEHNVTQNTWRSSIIGLIGINIIIIIHECGHFFAAHFFNIPTPTFSIGFGPALLQIPIGTTLFQFALLPLGGYVEINQQVLENQPYVHKIIVMSAGIFFNIIFSSLIFFYYSWRKIPVSLQACLDYSRQQNNNRSIIGPIGLISLIGKSFLQNKQLFFIMLALVSFNIAIFNILPLPFLDGGKIFLITMQALIGQHYPSGIVSMLSVLLLLFFILFISAISINDIKRTNKSD